MQVIEAVQFDTHIVEGQNYKALVQRLPTEGLGPRVRDVDGDRQPTIGFVWYVEGEDGNTKLYKANYDSSD